MSHGNPEKEDTKKKKELINGLRGFHCTMYEYKCVINYVWLSSDMYFLLSGWKGYNILIINIKINTGLFTFYISFFALPPLAPMLCPPASRGPNSKKMFEYRFDYFSLVCRATRLNLKLNPLLAYSSFCFILYNVKSCQWTSNQN